jgi:hypothetical protein
LVPQQRLRHKHNFDSIGGVAVFPEVAVGVWLLGEDFEQLDMSAELRP